MLKHKTNGKFYEIVEQAGAEAIIREVESGKERTIKVSTLKRSYEEVTPESMPENVEATPAVEVVGSQPEQVEPKKPRHIMEKENIDALLEKVKKPTRLLELLVKKVYDEIKAELVGSGIKNLTKKTKVSGKSLLSADKIIDPIESKYVRELDEQFIELAKKKGFGSEDIAETLKRVKIQEDYLKYLYMRALMYMNAKGIIEESRQEQAEATQ